MSDQEDKKSVKPSGKAAWIWLGIFLILGVLLLLKNFDSEKPAEFNQSQFIDALKENRILSADIYSEANDVLSISGRYLLAAEATSVPVKETARDKKSPRREYLYKTRVQKTDTIDKLLQERTEAVTVKPNNDSWYSLLGSILPLVILFIIIYIFAARQFRNANKGAFEFGKSKARMIPPDELKVKFADIAGADEAKEEIAEIVEFLKDPLKFKMLGGKIPKGCLLVGEPGTGKTLMAKAVACEAGVPFFAISGSDFVEMFVGVGASRVRDMFEQARKNMPCLIFIDEIDAVGRSRFSGWGGGHDEREQTLNAMLVEMDGLESRNGVIVLAATNRPDVLDPALLRPGRFDRQVVMDLPDIAGRRQILEVHVKKIKVTDNIDLDVIARTTPGFSGADLANICNEAALLAARRNKDAVSQAELEEARDKVSYGTERRSRKITERERVLTAYHEAGHALVALHNEHCTPVHKVTIIPRGQAYLGATFTMPKEDVYTKSKLELEAEMAMCMGGRAAEELTMGDITTGASADIQHLTGIARRMVCMFGMTDIIGPTQVGDFSIHPHLRIDGPTPDQLAPETAREIDLEIRRLVNTALEEARTCLTEHRDELEKLAQALLERETISIDEIDVLLGRKELPEEEVSVQDVPETVIAENTDDSTGTDSPAEGDL